MFVGELCLVEMQPTDFSRKTTGFLVVRRMIRVVNNNVSSGVFACSCGGVAGKCMKNLEGWICFYFYQGGRAFQIPAVGFRVRFGWALWKSCFIL